MAARAREPAGREDRAADRGEQAEEERDARGKPQRHRRNHVHAAAPFVVGALGDVDRFIGDHERVVGGVDAAVGESSVPERDMSVQLGGGTYIGRAMSYCEKLVDNPTRTVFVLISDFCEGAPPREMYAATARLNEARVKLIGLAALDDNAAPDYDAATAQRLQTLGMQIGAMTPDRFAEWLAGVMQ